MAKHSLLHLILPTRDNVTATETRHAAAPRMTPYGGRYQPPDGIKRKALAVGRETIRRFGVLTGSWRMTPDYLIIGTKRGGTTSLARWLLEHPSVHPLFPSREHRKGTYYFDVNFHRGEAWYRSHFPTTFAHRGKERLHGNHQLLGEATPYYLYHPHAAARAATLIPTAKIIVLLRNPIDRAHGHWAERFRQGVEYLDFEQALDAEPQRLEGEEDRMIADPTYNSFAHQHWSYVDQGRYARGLNRWMQHYPQDQMLVLRSEDLYRNPIGVHSEALSFLELEAYRPEELKAWNMKPRDPIEERIRQRLAKDLAPDIAEVESLLTYPMGWL